jgi:flagellar assembly protein FliH
MSSRAKRISNPASVVAFPWQRRAAAADAAGPDPSEPTVGHAQAAALEREAYARGYAEGEAAGLAAGAQECTVLVRELTKAADDVIKMRSGMLRQTERQMVQLALAVAQRVVQRELAVDPALLLEMARGVVARIDESARVTVRLNPQDYDASGAAAITDLAPNVAITADSKVEPGGCRIESDFGTLEAGVEAQILEFGRALLGEDAPSPVLSNVA